MPFRILHARLGFCSAARKGDKIGIPLASDDAEALKVATGASGAELCKIFV